MIGELSQQQIAEQIAAEKRGLEEAPSRGVNLVKRLIGTLKKTTGDVENEIKKLETGKLKSYEDPEKAMLTKHMPGVLQQLISVLKAMSRNGVPIKMEELGIQVEGLDTGQEDLLEEIVLMAVDEGDFYRKDKDAKGAVKKASKDLFKTKTDDLKYDLKVIEKDAVKEVSRQWNQK